MAGFALAAWPLAGVPPVWAAGLLALAMAAGFAGRLARLAERLCPASEAVLLAKESETAMRRLLEQAPVGIWQLDATGATVFANGRLRALFGGRAPAGLPQSGLLRNGGDGPFEIAPGEEREAVLPGAEGREGLRLQVAASAWPTEGGMGRLLSVLDVTALHRAQARVEHLSEHDALTGLANRETFGCALGALAGAPMGGLLLLLDLDHFRSANERFGHVVGDRLLREAAERLRGAVRPTDLVCRLGADEFAILAFEAGPESALPLAGRVRAALRPPVRLDGLDLSISASIGIAAAPGDGRDGPTLMRAAELALHEAKAHGRNTVCLFEPQMRERHEQRAALREALEEALEEGELEIHLQPQQDMERQVMVGAEALIRWKSSRLGRWVPPGEILPAANEGGVVQRLDRFVLHRAVGLLAQWADRPDAPATLAINISVASLHDPGFATEVAEALARARVAPERLEIEIPEDLAIRDLPGVQKTLQALREVGVPLALDDFGGGHSGLPHVVRLPVQRLKLDRSIVSGLPDDPKALAVLRATISLARGMGIEVVGEGVETEAQAFALRRAGCHVMQGWLIARPMAPELLVPPLAALPSGEPERARA
ncbi:MAG: EAL domain-containing protein [Roseococcus sp.]|nr:EAL domain-containing protein [Roseococcus sp.]